MSLDFELIWGTLDKRGPDGFRKTCEVERKYVIDRLLNLFVEFRIPATWCVVGHLMLDHCTCENGVKHKSIVPPTHSWCQDWFAHDPCGDETSFPLFYGRSLVEKIRDCSVPQEIGCHSFSHVIFGDAGCSIETARSELAACKDAAEKLNIQMHSFVFPRNQVGHLNALKDFGFRAYRGPEPHWYNRIPVAILQRLARLSAVFLAAQPPVVVPEKTSNGLWNVPASMLYFPMHGIRRMVPLNLRVARAIKGLDAAVRSKRIFHLWFHPTNLADEMETMFQGLRNIFEYADSLRDRNEARYSSDEICGSAGMTNKLKTFWNGKNVVITGASSGLGAALVAALSPYNIHFCLLSRRVEPMQELAGRHTANGSRFWIRACDIRKREDVETAIAAFVDSSGVPDVAWINSGVVGDTSFERWDWNVVENILDTNLKGALYTAHTCLRHMVPRNQGTIVAISSAAAMRGLGGRAIYSLSKIGLAYYMESMAAELTRIQFTTIYPGFVDTPANRNNPNRFWLLTAEDAAQRMIRAVANGKAHYIYPLSHEIALSCNPRVANSALSTTCPPHDAYHAPWEVTSIVTANTPEFEKE